MGRGALAILALLLLLAGAGVWLVMRDSGAAAPISSVARRTADADHALPTFDGVAPTERPASDLRAALPDSAVDSSEPAVAAEAPRRHVSGRIVRASDGTPCPNCQFAIADVGHVALDVPRGDDASFSVDALVSTTEITVSPKAPYKGRSQTFPLPPRDVSGMVIVYDSGFTLRGRVVDGNGAPLGDATVRVELLWETHVDAAGAFEFKDVSPGEGTSSVTCTAQAPLHTREFIHVMAPRDVTQIPTIELRLAGSGAIEGMVTDKAGQPRLGEPVRVLWEMATSYGTKAPSHLATISGRALMDNEEEGRYRLDNVPAGRYVVRAGGPWHPELVPSKDTQNEEKLDTLFMSRVVPDVIVEEGRTTHLDITEYEGGQIDGRVTDSLGAPIADATVLMRGVLRWPAPDQNGSSTMSDGEGLEIVSRGGADGAPGETVLRHDEQSATTDLRGNYQFLGVTEGEKTLTASARGSDGRLRPQSRTLHVQPEQRLGTVDFVLPVGFTVTGRVVDIAGAPLVGAMVFVKEPDQHTYREADATKTGDDGRFEIPGVAPEANKLTIQLSGYATLWQVVQPGGAAETYVLKRAPRVRGEVTDALHDQPIDVLNVSVATDDSMWVTTGQQFPSGQFDVDVEDDKVVTVRVSADGYVEDVREGVVPSLTENAPLRFRLVKKP